MSESKWDLQRTKSVWESYYKDTSILDDIREFTSETSAHGLKYIFEGPHRLVKLLFLVMWMGFSAYATFTICTSIVVYVNKPTGTKFEVVVDADPDHQDHGIKFPTVTVCTTNKVKKSFLNAEENKIVKEYFDIVDTYNLDTVKKELDGRFDDPEDEMYTIKNRTYESLLEAGGPKPDRFLMCSQRGKYCNELEAFNERGYLHYFSMENSMVGRCWRINPDGRLEGKMGDYGSLKLKFWADVQDYGDRTADMETHGFIVAFHDNETYGSTMFSGVLMSPGNYYKADLTLKETTYNKEKASSCNASLVDTTYGMYNEGACVLECKDRSLNATCGCVNVLPPENNGKYKACTLDVWAKCGLPHYKEWHANYSDTKRRESICPCQVACIEKKYESDISTSSLSPAYARKLFSSVNVVLSNEAYGFSNSKHNISYTTPDDIMENMMVLEVIFTSMQKLAVNEIITYDMGNLLGDIGGVLGLFLGASVFTIFEFVIFGVICLTKVFLKLIGQDGREYESLNVQN